MTRRRESIMTRTLSLALAAIGIFAGSTCLAQTQARTAAPAPVSNLERMPEALETRFALSAIPPHLRDAATVLLLDPAKGYVVSRNGTNGISCLVIRSDWQFPTRPFRTDIYWAVGFDAEGAQTLMQDYLTAAELRAQGKDSKQVHQEITKKFGTARYPNPSRAGVAYMIAPIMRGVDDTNVPEPKTMNMPHYMIYAPGVSNADIGGKPISMYPFMLSMSPGRDDFIIMLVGQTEKAGILAEFKDLLADLCSYRDYLCTNARTRMDLPTKTGTEGL
jgi:hypothetical protein